MPEAERETGERESVGERAAEEKPKPAEGRGRRRAVWTVAPVLLVVLLAGVAAGLWWLGTEAGERRLAGFFGEPRPPLAEEAADAALPKETERVARLADEVSGLRQSVEESQRSVERLAARLDSFEEVLDEVRAVLAEAPAVPPEDAERRGTVERLGERVADLASRLERAEQQAVRREAAPIPTEPFLVATVRLTEALRGARPFAAEFAAVAAAAVGDGEVARLLAPIAGHAERGVPDLAALRARFAEAAGGVRHREEEEREAGGAGWFDRVRAGLSSLVRVRRLAPGGAPAEETPAALVAKGGFTLAEGHLAAAIDAVGRLEGTAAHAFADWLDGANARLAADANGPVLLALAVARAEAAVGARESATLRAGAAP